MYTVEHVQQCGLRLNGSGKDIRPVNDQVFGQDKMHENDGRFAVTTQSTRSALSEYLCKMDGKERSNTIVRQ